MKNEAKKTYYAMIDGQEKMVRKSAHDYHWASIECNMMAETKEKLLSRMHSEFFYQYNYLKRVGSWNGVTGRFPRKATSEELEKAYRKAEDDYNYYSKFIVEIYTK